MAEPPEMADTGASAMDEPDWDEPVWDQASAEPAGAEHMASAPPLGQDDATEQMEAPALGQSEPTDEQEALALGQDDATHEQEAPALGQSEATDEQEALALGQDEMPGELEDILARLVAADIAQPAVLARLLGVDEAFIARPRRTLLRVGILAANATGSLRLTPRGQAWLQSPAAAPAPVVAPSMPALPELDPLPPALEPVAERSPKTSKRTQGPKLGFGLPRAVSAWRRAVPAPLRGVRIPSVRLPGFVPSGLVVRRRLALVGASALLIIVAGKTGLYSFGSASATAAQAPHADVKATATPWKIADLSTPAPTSTP